jgi:hypothetical protein
MIVITTHPLRVLTLLLTAIGSLSLIGCGTGISTSNVEQYPNVRTLHGTVYGGQQPVSGASLQLYAAGNIGYGSAAKPLIPSGSYYAGGVSGCVPSSSQICYPGIVSDANGDFNITNDYSCSNVTTPVFLTATGGSPGLSYGTNANIALMVALGSCTQLQRTAVVTLNELTTVASVWALSPFMSGITNMGTSATNAVGLTNAFATVNTLVNTGSGTVPTPTPPGFSGTVNGGVPAISTLPTLKLNTLADIVASCINSSGGVSGDNTACGSLFAATKVGSATVTDTITAAMNIAQHPSQNVSTLFSLSSPNAPFQNTLATAPTDWELIVTYSGGGLSTPKAVAVDGFGNLWLPNYGNSSVTELNNVGAAISGANGITAGSISQPIAVAIDPEGYVWVANSNSTITKLTSTSVGTVFSGGGLNSPSGLAIDAASNIWIANAGNSSVTLIAPVGTVTNYTGFGVPATYAVAIDPK